MGYSTPEVGDLIAANVAKSRTNSQITALCSQ